MTEHKASIHIEDISNNPIAHNQRVFEPDYLITEPNVETYNYNTDLIKLKQKIIDDYESYNRGDEKNPKHQRWQKKSRPIKEAVVNVKSTTTEDELLKLKEELEKNFGVEILQMSNHKDEGHFVIVDDKTGYEYTVDRKDNKQFRTTKDGETVNYTLNNPKTNEDIKISGTIKRVFNYHCHIVMNKYNFKEHRITKWKQSDLKKMQTMVSQVLGMERGVSGSKTKRLTHWEYTHQQQMKQFEEIVIDNEITLKIKDVKRFFKFNKQLAIQLKTFEQKDYQELSKLQKQIHQKVKNKEYANVQELNKDLNKIILQTLDKKSSKTFAGHIKYTKEERANLVHSLRKDFLKFMETDIIVLENIQLKTNVKKLSEQIEQYQELFKDDTMMDITPAVAKFTLKQIKKELNQYKQHANKMKQYNDKLENKIQELQKDLDQTSKELIDTTDRLREYEDKNITIGLMIGER